MTEKDRVQVLAGQIVALMTNRHEWSNRGVDAVEDLVRAYGDDCAESAKKLWLAAEEGFAKQRARAEAAEAEVARLSERLTLTAASEHTGHLFRCARVNGAWSCGEGCPAARIARLEKALRGLAYESDALRIPECVPEAFKERVWMLKAHLADCMALLSEGREGEHAE